MDLRTLLTGPPFALPRLLDGLAERWRRLPARPRMVLAALLWLLAASAIGLHAAAVQARWGGAPVTVLAAQHDLPAGAPAARLAPIALPRAAVPPRALSTVPPGAVLSIALPAGSVLTRSHLDPRGPAAGLPADLRVVPIPVETGGDVEAGEWVDVWVLGAGEQPSRLAAASRVVVGIRSDETAATVLVALATGEVGAVTAGLALGKILLTHAPAPMTPAPG